MSLVAYYTMSEPAGSTRANDTSGNNAPPLVAWDYPYFPSGQNAPAFGAAGLSTDDLTAVQFANTASKASQPLRAELAPTTLGGVGFFLSATGVGSHVVFEDVANVTHGGTGDLQMTWDDTSGLVAVPKTGSTVTAALAADGAIHHVFLKQDGGDILLYVDGVLKSTAAGTLGTLGPLIIGEAGAGPAGTNALTIAHFAVFSTAPTADRIADMADAGLTGFAGEAAHLRLARYAGYAGIPSAEYSFDAAAVTPMAHIDTTGQTPMELMQKVATTDGGVLYDGADGTLTYRARTVRYNSATALTLDVAAGEVEATYQPKLDRSALINKVTATITDGTYSVTAQNTTSSDEYGTHSNADLELATTNQDEAHAAAWWRVNTYSEPSVRAPQLGVKLAKLNSARQAAILALEVGDKITVTNLPSQSDASTKSFFVEGYTETITDSEWLIEFNVSPTTGFEVWEIDHPVYGQYDAWPIAY